MRENLPGDWSEVLKEALEAPSFRKLERFVEGERRKHTVYPSEEDLFSAFRLTPYARVRVLLLGQDPYHGPGQAHGLAFSVMPGVPLPPSLVNIFKELQSNLGVPPPASGSLVPWAEQGVLLLNRVMSVRAGAAGSHRGKGWEKITTAAVAAVAARQSPDGAPMPLVALLWGKEAESVRPLLGDTPVVSSAHPSPLSASRGFFGSRPFSQVNRLLREQGAGDVTWELPPVP